MNSEEPAIFRHIHSCQRQLQAAAPALRFKAQAVASAIVLRLGTLATQARSQRSPLEEIEQALNTLDEELLTAMRASLPLAEIQVLQTIARQETAPYRRRLPSPRIEKMEVQCIERDLREKYMLPRFGLFYMLPFSNLTPEKRDCSFPERERRPSTKDENSTQLPIWPESVRGGPNALLRSALFAGIQYERSEGRKDTRAGSYERQLQTKAGEVSLKVPKLRSLPFETAIIERYRRRESSVEEALIEMYLAGVSVRRVEDITQALWGTRVSASTVSDLNQKIYKQIEEWRQQPLDGEFPYVFVDGLWLGFVNLTWPLLMV